MRVARRLLSEGQQAASLLTITVTLGLIGGLLIVWQSRLISQIINAAFLEKIPLELLSQTFITCLAIIGLRAGATWLGEICAHQAASRIKLKIRQALVTHLLGIGPAILLESEDKDRHTGELTHTLVDGVEALQAYYSQYLPQLALAVLVPLSILVFIAPLDPLTTIILLVTAPLLPLFMYLIGNASKNQTRRQWLQLSRMSAYFLEVIQGLPTLKALGRNREQSEMVDLVSAKHRQLTLSVLRITFLSALALEMVATLGTAVVAVEIGLRLLYGRLAFEQAFFLLLLAPEFYLPLRMLGLRFHSGIAGVEAGKRIYELLDTPLIIKRPLSHLSGIHSQLNITTPLKIILDQVNFSYQDGSIGVDNLSLEIPAGKVTMIVGASGAGKSTILSLLLGFFRPQSGRIIVNEQQLDETSSQDWAKYIAWVPQHPYLFQDSIAANISLGCPKASQAEIEEAARKAHADEFIQALPDKYDTQIGERGVRLSAGQAQRIALARAFLMDAPLLLLDEPGAHLDPETDKLMLDSVHNLMKGKTVIIISHKPLTRLHADQVIWLDRGRVAKIEKLSAKTGIESGNPDHPRVTSPQYPTKPQPTHAKHQKPASRKSSLRTIARLFQFLSPFKAQVALSILLSTFTIGSSMGLMTTAAYLIAMAALQPSIAELQVAIVGVRFFGLARGIFRYLERLMAHEVTFRLLGKWRSWFYKSIEPLVPARTLDKHSGDLLQRAVGDISTLEDFYVRGISPPLVAVLIGTAACLFFSQFSMTLVYFLASIMLIGGIILPMVILVIAREPGQILVKERAYLHQVIVDGIQGMPDLLACGQGERHLLRVVEQTSRLARVQARFATINGFQTAISRTIAEIGMLGILWLAIPLSLQSKIDGVLLGALTLFAFSSFEAFYPLSQAAQHLSTNLAAANRLLSLADTSPEVVDQANPTPVPNTIKLTVNNLTYHYPDHQTSVLTDFSLCLEAPRRVALVGSSGAGKSTLIHLLLRFWEYPPGAISLNDIELNQFAGDELRKKMSVLPQNPSLFSGTIIDNIRLIEPGASLTEIETAAHRAGIHKWVQSLPQGYQTWIGESGLKLSGGQRQRIALARTLLRVSPLLILDEPTSHLNVELEQDVLKGILEAVEVNHSALLMVTHRLVGMETMDEILVLENGRIIERGRHRELIAQQGLYRKLWNLQQ